MLQPPDCYNESIRRLSVDRYLKLEHWNDKSLFKKLIGAMRKTFAVPGVSISVIEGNRTLIKIEALLDMGDIPRSVSLDAHTILSQGYFLLLDASKDWRTSNNPFVKGVPFIKFYCGVPLITANKEIIGVLAIFDSSSKPEFSDEACKKLISMSKEVMLMLDTPVHELRNSLSTQGFQNTELNELGKKLGRATSNKSTLKTVFEKDGSGGPYSQNQNFRFTKLAKCEDANWEEDSGIDNKILLEKLSKIGSLKNSAMILTKAICLHYKVDLAYILEVRIAESYQIQKEYFPRNESKIEAENYRYANKLMKSNSENEIMTRIIGIHSKHSSLNFENTIHYKAFVSDFGIEYRNPKNNSIYNKGILMPFHRHSSKLVRRREKKDKEKNDMIDIYLRSGGYLIGLFNLSDVDYTLEKISNVFTNVGTFRRLYI